MNEQKKENSKRSYNQIKAGRNNRVRNPSHKYMLRTNAGKAVQVCLPARVYKCMPAIEEASGGSLCWGSEDGILLGMWVSQSYCSLGEKGCWPG